MAEFVGYGDKLRIIATSARINGSCSGRLARSVWVQHELGCATAEQQERKKEHGANLQSANDLHCGNELDCCELFGGKTAFCPFRSSSRYRLCDKRGAIVFQISEVLFVMMPSTPIPSSLLASSGSLIV